MPEYYDGFWFRCKRCRKAVFKLKNLMIRHLSLTHSIHRFDMDSDDKGDWERVLVKEGGEFEKVDLPVTPPKPILHLTVEPRKPTPPSQRLPPAPKEKQAAKAKEEEEGEEGARQPPKHQYQNRQKMEKQKSMDDNWMTIGIEEEQEGQQYVKTDPIISQTFYSVLENNVAESASTMTEEGTMSSSVDEYKCRYCSATFVHSRLRRIHEAKVHNEEFDGYACQVCFRNFPTIASVQDHYRCTHKMTPPAKKDWKCWRINGTDLDHYVQTHILSDSQIEAQEDHHAPRPCEIQSSTSTNEIINLVVSDQNFHLVNSQGELEECIVEEDNQQYSLNETYYFHQETGAVIPISLISNNPSTTTILTEPSIQQFNNSSMQQTHQVVTAVKSEVDPIGQYFSSDELSLPPKKKLKRSATFTSPPESRIIPLVNMIIEPENSPPPSTITTESNSAADQLLDPGEIGVIRLPRDSPLKYQRYSCPKDCSEKFRTQWEQVLHLANSHSEYICEFCNLTFSQKRDMIEHQYSRHNTESGHYQCRFCPLHHFTSPLMVQDHVYYDHKDQRIPSISAVTKWRRA